VARDSCKPSHMMSTLVCSAAGLHRLDRLTTHSPRTNTATELPKREVQSTNPTPNLRAADISVRADHRLSPCPPLTHTSETHILLSRYCSAGRVAHKTTETPFRSSSPHRGGHRGQLKNKNRTAPPFWNVPRRRRDRAVRPLHRPPDLYSPSIVLLRLIHKSQVTRRGKNGGSPYLFDD